MHLAAIRLRDKLGRILGVMTAMQQSPETMLLLHPAGPESSARAGMILASVAPGLQAEAQAMQQNLEEIRAVRTIRRWTNVRAASNARAHVMT